MSEADSSVSAQGTLIERLAVKLFAFMKQAGLKVGFRREDGVTFLYQVADMCEDGQPIGVIFRLDLPTFSKYSIEDTAESMEKFCYGVTLDIGNQLFKTKVQRLLEHDEKSKILVPGLTI